MDSGTGRGLLGVRSQIGPCISTKAVVATGTVTKMRVRDGDAAFIPQMVLNSETHTAMDLDSVIVLVLPLKLDRGKATGMDGTVIH